jgi:hypothetical protein
LTYKIPIITHQGFGDFCEWPFLSAGSTDRRNTCVESLCWCLELQGLTGSFVELAGDFIQMSL